MIDHWVVARARWWASVEGGGFRSFTQATATPVQALLEMLPVAVAHARHLQGELARTEARCQKLQSRLEFMSRMVSTEPSHLWAGVADLSSDDSKGDLRRKASL